MVRSARVSRKPVTRKKDGYIKEKGQDRMSPELPYLDMVTQVLPESDKRASDSELVFVSNGAHAAAPQSFAARYIEPLHGCKRCRH